LLRQMSLALLCILTTISAAGALLALAYALAGK
jgi:hypothetical protein